MSSVAKDPVLDQIVDDYLNAKAAEEKWKERGNELALELIDRVGEGNRYTLKSGSGIRVDPAQRRWSVARARTVLLPDQVHEISELLPTLELANRHLPAALVDECRTPVGRPRVIRI